MSALVLVVEDNPTNLMLTEALLRLAGHRPVSAGSAAEALQRLHEELPDLVLMDLQLPGEDGLSLTRRLKADPSTAAIPVVAVTAHAMGGDREAALAAGCCGYLTKPIDTRTFPEQIESFLRLTIA